MPDASRSDLGVVVITIPLCLAMMRVNSSNADTYSAPLTLVSERRQLPAALCADAAAQRPSVRAYEKSERLIRAQVSSNIKPEPLLVTRYAM
jgi:hypothetical protein